MAWDPSSNETSRIMDLSSNLAGIMAEVSCLSWSEAWNPPLLAATTDGEVHAIQANPQVEPVRSSVGDWVSTSVQMTIGTRKTRVNEVSEGEDVRHEEIGVDLTAVPEHRYG